MRLIAALAIAALGCESAPSNPTWTADVRPILHANCIKCHGKVPRGGAPLDFRLDSYFGATNEDGQALYGAALVARFIHERTHAETMPPVAPLSGVQIDTLENWFNTNAPMGDPVASNSPPELTVLDQTLDDQGFVVIEYQLSDPDFDVASGALEASGPARIQIPGELYSGRGTVRFDAAAAAEGSYELVAILNDGNDLAGVESVVGTVDVSHPDNTAPVVTIANPTGPDQLFPLAGDNEVRFTVEDADADAVDVTITAERGAEVIEVGTVADVELEVEQAVAFDPPASAAGGSWRIRVEASDGQLARSDRVGPLVFTSGPAPSLTFAGVQEILSAHCSGCHVSGGNPDEVGFAAGTSFAYGSIDSVLFFGGEVYRRVVLDLTMPARSTEILNGRELMPAADRELVGEWLLGGAPP